MKTHTQQQTNLEIETTQTEQKLSSRKRSKYRPRNWRGNTLVPVIIALAISAIATVAFLNQGADLSAKNKVVIAQNEVASAISEWVVSREATGGANAATTATLPPAQGDNIFGGNVSFAALGNQINAAAIFGGQVIPADTRYLVFPTDDGPTCTTLASRFTAAVDGINNRFCINNADPSTQNVAAGEILLIILN